MFQDLPHVYQYKDVQDQNCTTPILQTLSLKDIQKQSNNILKPLYNKLTQGQSFKKVDMPKDTYFVFNYDSSLTSPNDDDNSTYDTTSNTMYNSVLYDLKPAKSDYTVTAIQNIEINSSTNYQIDYVLLAPNVERWLKRSKKPIEQLLKQRKCSNFLTNLPLLNQLQVNYIPVVVTSYNDYFINYFPDIYQQVSTKHTRISTQEHPTFSQLVFFTKDQTDPDHLTYYYSMPINYELFNPTNLHVNSNLPVEYFPQLLMPHLDVSVKQLDKLNEDTRKLQFEAITDETWDGHQWQKTKKTLQTVLYNINDYNYLTQNRWDDTNHRFAESMNQYKSRNNSENQHWLQRKTAENYSLNLKEITNILQDHLEFHVDKDLTIHVKNTINSDFWQKQVNKVKFIKFNQITNYFKTIFMKNKDEFTYDNDDNYAFQHLNLNLSVDPNDITLCSNADTTENQLKIVLRSNASLSQQVKKAVLNQFQVQLKDPVKTTINIDLNSVQKPEPSLSPVSKPQHNLSQLFEQLLPLSLNHELYLTHNQLLDPIGKASINQLIITDLTDPKPDSPIKI